MGRGTDPDTNPKVAPKRKLLYPFMNIKQNKALAITLLLVLLPQLLSAQEPITIRVDANAKIGVYKPIYAYFGYDEPNYTYMKYGKKLVGELAQLSHVPVHIQIGRAHV